MSLARTLRTSSTTTRSATATTRKRRSAVVMMVAVIGTLLGTLLALAPAANASPVTVGLPATRAQINPVWLSAPHHDYPAVDLPLPAGTTARALFNGKVAWVGYQAGGCGYGVTLTATTADGRNLEATYCHARSLPALSTGQLVRAFEPVLSVGSTGASSGPHLHIQVKRNGVKVCPQPALRAAWAGTTYDFNNAPTSGCTY
ncbi:hypothetical protein ASE01_09345 [Nocardioides sp. Root190]|uniref:M23 family metallopeptidase n=1 Tax=Nocardioides sp. Root190 TaxID=1736488 RepID=UPI000700F072|nr:M23 family metallopeptidase [Nocardioides sp. Root190]KRB76964.1 hypothetical protein ASE01_09345 [Nocardioides sp. Root190]